MLKAQTTIETTLIAVALIIGAIIVIVFVLSLLSKSQQSISTSTIYTVTSVGFSPRLPLAPFDNTSYFGTVTLSMYSSTPPSFAYMVLMQNLNNSSINSSKTCPSYIQFTGFPKTSYVCIFLNKYSSILPEGGDQYILTFTNVQYNITAFNISNSTENGQIGYVYFNNNGKGSYTQLNPPLTITIT